MPVLDLKNVGSVRFYSQAQFLKAYLLVTTDIFQRRFECPRGFLLHETTLRSVVYKYNVFKYNA